MSLDCENCGAPVQPKPGETEVTCIFCRKTMKVPVDLGAQKAEMLEALTEALRAQAAQASQPRAYAPPPFEVRAQAQAYVDPDAAMPKPSSSRSLGGFVLAGLGVALIGMVVVVAVAISVGTSADSELPPTLGRLDLDAPGAESDRTLRGFVRSSVSASRLDSSCRGDVDRAPTALLHLREAAIVTLTTNDSPVDLTLALRSQAGEIFCDDDSGSGTNPRLVVTLGPGDHAVWVGTYHADEGASVGLRVSTEALPGAVAAGHARALTTGPLARVQADSLPNVGAAGEAIAVEPGVARTVDGTSGGSLEADGLGTHCRGFIAARPNTSLVLASPMELTLTTSSTADLTMVVRSPDGTFRCDDDTGEGNNPLVYGPFPPGRVDVWIGSFQQDAHVPYVLSVLNEATPTGAIENGLAIESMPTAGVIDASGLPSGGRVPGMTGARIDARALGGNCRGHLPRTPSAAIETAEPIALSVTTESSTDLVMAIRYPDGTYVCDDDSNGNQPRIVGTFPPGRSLVFVGTFGTGSAIPYQLLVDAPSAATSAPSANKPPPHGSRRR